MNNIYASYHLQYLSGDEVDADNKESCVRKTLAKFRKGELTFQKDGWYKCPFCTKDLKDGLMTSLVQHACQLKDSGKDLKTRAKHQALGHALIGDVLPNF